MPFLHQPIFERFNPMLNVTTLVKPITRFANDNAPALLTAFGAVGAITTAVLAGKASWEAADLVASHTSAANAKREAGQDRVELKKSEKLQLIWTLYIPAVTTGTVTVGAIIMSHRISSRRAAVLAAAYALNEGKLEEYQDKIKEKFGVKKEKEARTELTQERINREYDETEVLLFADDNKVLMREDYTGRFFWGTVEQVNQAVNEINAKINRSGRKDEQFALLSHFHKLLGLSDVSTSHLFGWTQEHPLSIDWNTCTTPDGTTAVHTFDYVDQPVMNPEREASFL